MLAFAIRGMAFAFASLLASSSMPFKPLNIPTTTIRTGRGGIEMPMGGIGTWLYNDTVAEDAVHKGLSLGARMIDTAYAYQNQKGVARGIKASGVPLSEIFIVTKVPGGLSTEATIAAHESNLKDLGVDKVDLLLTHFPCAMTNPPQNCSKAARQATWKGLEAVYNRGQARAIGVSHYCQRQLEDILEIATVPIALNQEEWHVGMGPDPSGVVSFCKKNKILYQSFSPLCGPCPPADKRELINGDLVTSIGKAHNVSGAQVSLRWLVEMGSPVIPKSDALAHLHENLDLFSWSLTADEQAKLSAATTPPSAEPVSADCQFPMAEVEFV